MKTLIIIWLIGVEASLLCQVSLWCSCYSVIKAVETNRHTTWAKICYTVLKDAGVTNKRCVEIVYSTRETFIAIVASLLWPITMPIGLFSK